MTLDAEVTALKVKTQVQVNTCVIFPAPVNSPQRTGQPHVMSPVSDERRRALPLLQART